MLLTAGAAGVTALLAAGCAQQAQPGAGPAGTILSTPTTTVHSIPETTISVVPMPPVGGDMPAGATPVTGPQINAGDLPSGYPRSVWTEHNGTTLVMLAEQGGCLATKASVAEQSPTQVLVRLTRGSTVSGQTHACPMYLTYRAVTVNLAAPLGHRTVVLELSEG